MLGSHMDDTPDKHLIGIVSFQTSILLYNNIQARNDTPREEILSDSFNHRDRCLVLTWMTPQINIRLWLPLAP
jgi:hypothetical protein